MTASTSTAPPVSAATLHNAKWWTPGIPAPKGSARAIKVGKGDKARAVLVASSSDTNKRAQTSWATAVGSAAKAALAGYPPIDGPVSLRVAFYVPRPKSTRRDRPTVKPDLDKLLRATLDALTGIAFGDDAQVVVVSASKDYADAAGPGAWVEVWRVSETTTTGGEPARSER